MDKAKKLGEIKNSMDPRPLRSEELSTFFVETAHARDAESNRRFELFDILDTSIENVKILLAGHSGCGKSTELAQFCTERSDRFFPITFSIRTEATLSSLSIEQLLVLIVERFMVAARPLEHRLSAKTLESVYEWFAETFQKREDTADANVSAGAKIGTEASLLEKIIGIGAWLKADIRAGARVIHSTITRDNRRLGELAARCNVVIREVVIACQAEWGKDVLLVIEDLDKAFVADATKLFFDEPGPLADLPCKAIYTIPIFLQCSPRMQNLDPRFVLVTLPMIKTRHRDGSPCDEGIAVMTQLVEKRMDGALIDADALRLCIEKTGGVPRDLFDVLVSAASVARQAVATKSREAERITYADVRYGLNRRKSFILRGITVDGLPFKDTTVDQLYDALRQYGDRAVVNAPSDHIHIALMQAHALIEYNGERWYRIHPLVLEHVNAPV